MIVNQPTPKHVFIKYSRNQQFHLFEYGRMVHTFPNDNTWNPTKKFLNPRTKRPYNLCSYCANYLDGKPMYNRNLSPNPAGSLNGCNPTHIQHLLNPQGVRVHD